MLALSSSALCDLGKSPILTGTAGTLILVTPSFPDLSMGKKMCSRAHAKPRANSNHILLINKYSEPHFTLLAGAFICNFMSFVL